MGSGLIPPGQDVVEDFPVLTAGATPVVDLSSWDFTIASASGAVARRWTWQEFRALPSEPVVTSIHCVTGWSKLDTTWEGVSVDVLLEGLDHEGYVVAFAEGGYTTNLPIEDLTGGKAWVAWAFDGDPLEPVHGGPARLLVPHLYFWKSAKWVRGLRLSAVDEPGFWEQAGYHNYGDPWRQQRHRGDA